MYAEHTDTDVATVEIVESGSRLRVRWQAATPEQFADVLRSFRCWFMTHGAAVWLADDKCWSLPLAETSRLRRWLRETFRSDCIAWSSLPRAEHSSSSGRPSSSSLIDPTVQAAYASLHLQVTAPPEVVLAATRALAKLYHPDRGGDHAAMVAVNAAAELIREHQAATSTRQKARSSTR